MSKITSLPEAPANIPVAKVLENSKDMVKVLVVSYDANGALHMQNSHMSNGEALWMLESAKKLLMS